MSNKLQELTDRLYNEGLSKGKEEGELLLAKAHKDADKIISEANAKAEETVAEAARSAEALKAKAESDVKMASSQSLLATKKDIENLLVNAVVDSKVDAALADVTFIKGIISEVAGKFSTEQNCDLSLVLPESIKSELAPWVSSELKKALGKEVEAEFSKKIAGGFKIAPKDGSWYISLTDETFKSLIKDYMRPVTRKILFGDDE